MAPAALGRAKPSVAMAEQRWVIEYLPLVKRVVSQLNAQIGGTLEREDLEQIGLVGLLQAIRRYGEPDEHFTGYAWSRVRGEILDELRRQDWRSRSVRRDAHRMRDATRAFAREHGREPTEHEMCVVLGVTLEQYQASAAANRAESLLSFDELGDDAFADHEGPEQQLAMRASLEHVLAGFDERTQRVVQLSYEYGLSLKEIAAVLDLTEARVCQIRKAAVVKMKHALEAA
ncbi:RNA polymerase sigma factor FliA [Burkholderia ubonensis]|uniref:RNA polymerase sigma factor FliA n=1 Tax=Burkholderia ubonensis TaxID=101571 RepID=UPI000755E436|nr:RNA polymerase sigma factor FliA [Burkholderia ubonensis]KWB79415.1 flagellar biosynthesis sigma factor [Burkholderia ubonensis]